MERELRTLGGSARREVTEEARRAVWWVDDAPKRHSSVGIFG